MNHPKRVSALLLIACMNLVACSEATTVEVFNNTGDAIGVTSCSGQKLVEPRAVHLLHLSACSESPQVSIQSGSNTWVYGSLLEFNAPFMRQELRGRRFPAGIVFRAQLEADGSAFFVPPKYSLPVSDPRNIVGVVVVLPNGA